MTQRLKKQYIETIIPKLTVLYKYENKHQVPKIEKIVINRGIGDASQNQKMVEASLKEIAVIAGQKGVITRTKKPNYMRISIFLFYSNLPSGGGHKLNLKKST